MFHIDEYPHPDKEPQIHVSLYIFVMINDNKINLI